jgi:hypothetical protein
VAVPIASALLVTGCTGDLAGGGGDASLPAQVASGTVLAVNIHEGIICVAVEKPTAELAGGCYDLGIRTDVVAMRSRSTSRTTPTGAMRS